MDRPLDCVRDQASNDSRAWRARASRVMMLARGLVVVAWVGASGFSSESVLASAICDAPSADWVFCEDFESGDLAVWDSDTRALSEYRMILPDAGPSAGTGNHVFRLRVPAGRNGTGINKTFTPIEFERLYARWYIAYEEGFDFSAANHGHGLHAGERYKKGVAGTRPSGDDWFTSNVEYLPSAVGSPARPYIYTYYRGMKMDCANPDGSCWGDHAPCMIQSSYCDRIPALRVRTYPPPLEHARWYCVELMIDAGDPVTTEAEANGMMNLWIDGLEIGPWDKMWFRTSSNVRLNHFWLGLFHHDEHSREGLMFDDVVVSTSRVGCSARPQSPSDLQAH